MLVAYKIAAWSGIQRARKTIEAVGGGTEHARAHARGAHIKKVSYRTER
jgi:hypothetical protein